MRISIVILLCGSLAAGSGCTRTSDGTVQLKPMALPAMPTLKFGALPGFGRKQSTLQTATRFPGPPPQETVAAQQEQPAAAARRPPRRTNRSDARIKAPRIAVMQPFKPAPTDDAKPLTCHNQTEAGGRVKVVCR